MRPLIAETRREPFSPTPVACETPVGSLLIPERLNIWAWVLGYTAILTTLSVLRYNLWLATGLDLGMYKQALWLIWHRGLQYPSSFTGHPLLGLHASYILLPLSLLYRVGGTGALLCAQAFSLGLGYLLLRRIAETLGVSPGTAHAVGTAYLLFPVVLGSNLFDFHPVTLALPAVLAAIDASLRGRGRWLAAWLVVGLLCSDTLVLPIFTWGLALLMQRRTRLGLLTAALATIVAAVDALLVLPHLGGPGVSAPAAALLSVAGLSTRATAALVAIQSLRGWEYLIWLLAPLSGLLALGRRQVANLWWVPGVAVVVANLTHTTPAATSPFNQLTLPAVPFLFTAVLASLAGPASAPRRWFTLGPVALFLIVFAAHQVATNWRNVPHAITSLTAVANRIPPTAPVIAQNFALAHLAGRSVARLPVVALRKGMAPGTYILLVPGTTAGTTPTTALGSLEARAISLGHAKRIYHRGGITLLKTKTRTPGVAGRA